MDYELRQAKEKWEREQREKKERARREREREKKAREAAANRQQAIEAAHLARRLEEAAATQAAQLREEEDMWLGDGIAFDKVLRAFAVSGGGDKIRLPASAFGELSSQNAIDKGPMFFEVSVDRPGGRGGSEDEEDERVSTHSGVLEFVAQEGCVELPPHVWQNAGLAEEALHGRRTHARVRYVRLPKATYAKFRAEGLDFVDVPNHKAVLETALRQHATLSVGDLLTVQHAGVGYELRVMELKPSSSLSVLETDMEADVVGGMIDTKGQQPGSSAQSRLVPLELGKAQKGVVSEGRYAYFKFTLDTATAKSVADGLFDVIVRLDVVGGGSAADADMYVGAHPLLFPTQHNHEWSSNDKGTKVIALTLSERRVSAGSYSIGVHGYFGEAQFEVLVLAKATQGHKESMGQRTGKRVVTSGSDQEEGFGPCENCKQLVPLAKKVLHEAYCFRHNVLCKHPNCGIVLRREEMDKHEHCEKCGQAVGREELEKHLKVFHHPLQCGCGQVLEMEEMVVHRANACPLRSVTCRFCGDMVQAGAQAENVRDRLRGLTQHESSCGSRTAPCDFCGRATMLKEMDLHKAAAHGSMGGSISERMDLGTPPRPPPSSLSSTPSSVASTPRMRDGDATVSTSVIQCPICATQFGGGDATWRLNVHIDSDHLGVDFKDPTAAAMEVDKGSSREVANNIPSAFFSRARTLSVSCPICGIAVHSERDLSSHIDTVH